MRLIRGEFLAGDYRMVKYSEVDLGNLPLADKPVKLDNVLVVPFDPPIQIQTEDTLTAVSPLCTRTEEGVCEILPSLTAKAGGPLLDFLVRFEQAILSTAKSNSGKWWPRRNLDADVIENGLKSYMKAPDVIKLKVDTSMEPLVYDQQGAPADSDNIKPGQRFWAVLEAQRVVIGKTEFGMVWRLHQLMHKPARPCVVIPQEVRVRPADEEVSEFA